MTDTTSAVLFVQGSLPSGDASAGDIAAEALARAEADAMETAAREAADNLGDTIRLSNIAGTGDAVTADVPAAQAHISMTVGQFVDLKWPADNAAADPTVTVGGVVFIVRRRSGAALAAGDLRADATYRMRVHATGADPRLRVQQALTAGDINGLGTAAAADAGDFATAAQGATADNAVQPGDAVSVLAETATAKIMTGDERTSLAALPDDIAAEAAARAAGDATNADALATHAARSDNPHAVTKSQVGLSEVDNTSDAGKPVSSATQAALDLKADEADLAAEVATRESLIVSKDGGGVVITDPAGFVLARINADGSIKTVMHDIGVGADGGLVVRDPAGFVLFRVGRDGALSLGGNVYMRGDFGDGLVVTDPAGFVLMRADSSGMRVLGEAVGGDAGEQARTGVLRRGLTGMHRWRQARGNVVQAYGEARILCIGDSNTAGGTVDVGVSRRANAYPTALATLLDRHYGATSAGFYGSAGQGAAYPTYDPRVALGSGWSPVGAAVSLGGEVFANTTTTAALTFTPGIEWDTAEIIVAGLAAGDLTADVGGAASPYSATVGAVTTLTFDAGSVGAHTLSISRVSGEVHVVGVICRNSAAPAITVVNGGRGGWKTSDLVDDAEFYSPLNVLPAVVADLVLIEIGINDHTAGVTPATYAANLQTIIDACPSGADVALVSSVTPTSAGKAYFWADYQTAMYAVAAANDLPVIDMTVAMGDRPVIEAQSWNVDNVHPTRAGLAEKANAILKLLTK